MKLYLFLLPLLFFFLPLKSSGQRGIRFEYISIEQGLSQNSVNSICQDNEGFMWFGTMDGLNRYDGYEIKVFRNIMEDSTSIVDNYVNVTYVDRSGVLWVGTHSGGLCYYTKEIDRFTTLKHNPKNQNSLCDDRIQCLYQDHDGWLWIGTQNGLNRYNPKTKEFVLFKAAPNLLSSDVINHVAEDKAGNIWIATNNGVNRYNKRSKNFTHFFPQIVDPTFLGVADRNQVNTITVGKNGTIWFGTNHAVYKIELKNGNYEQVCFTDNATKKNVMSNNKINSLLEDNSGILWIGTEKNGLYYIDHSSNYFAPSDFNNNPYNQLARLNSNNVTIIFQDKSKILWIGTSLGGLCKWERANEAIELYRRNPFWTNTLSSNQIRTIYEDSKGFMWIGTVDAGLNQWNLKFNQFVNYSHDTKETTSSGNQNIIFFGTMPQKNQLSNNHVRSILEDSKGNLWVGTADGLNLFDDKKKEFIAFHHLDNSIESLPNDEIWKIFEDSKHRIWLGTYGGGLVQMNATNPKNPVFTVYSNNPDNPKSLSDNKVTTIFEDHTGTLWVGTFDGGLNKFDDKNLTFTHYSYSRKNFGSIGNDRIYSIMEDRDKVLWIGTKGSLNRFDRKTEKFKRYTEKDGLPNSVIMGILEDNSGNLWISTNKGISRFDKKNRFTNYDIRKGLQSNEFLVGSYFKSREGKMYFGGINGFNAFMPDSVKNNTYPPDLFVTDFKLFNKSERPDPNGILKTHINYTKTIELKYNQNSFSFDFVVLHYSQPESNTCYYKLENWDKDWIKTETNKRMASYTNLNPGKYIFRLKGTNSEGIYSTKEVAITIIISPPFWGTWWFRISGITIVFLTVYTLYRSRIKRIEHQKQILEKQVIERTAEVERQKEELEKLSIVARKTDNAVMIMDEKGNFEWVNEGFTRMFEYTCEQLVTEVSKNIIGQKTSLNNKLLINKCLNEKQTVTYELLMKTRSGKELWIQTTLTPILNSKGDIVKLVAIDSDIDTLKKAEKEIREQNRKIQSQNEHIRGSIRYAQTIQSAILPREKTISEFFNTFIFYAPKDIVSGDFYWYSKIVDKNSNVSSRFEPLSEPFPEKITMPNETKIFFVVSDCTGHGVPGAFMSLIGNRLLSEIINEMRILKPSAILETLDDKINVALNQFQTDNNDGMDICLCSLEKIDDYRILLTFSGAKRPLYYYNSETNLIDVFGGDRRTIGGSRIKKDKAHFSDQQIVLKHGDRFYLSTDGMIDQHAKDRKRFGTNRLVDLIQTTASLEMYQQKDQLISIFKEYQKEEEQRDDITLLGIKII